ncbi:hypothetical protein [Epilithonimonas zeae]|uniref:hypothetical protein n=1 Tax=Epilithonimonas zeae TaxID=1416779 RepID=UPI00200E6205|nr:hypothetical protein [Epilithonimonas zeae]UQB69875.1 hypothetical protein KI430_05465 [Epilithonimonas zeae]
MMKFKALLFAPILLLMSNCKTQSQTSTSDNIIKLGVNKKVTIPNSKTSIEFKEIIEDSRCPANVTCVWEGIAIVNLNAFSGKDTKDIKVATRDFLPKEVTKSFNYAGYRFTVQEVKPYPGGKEEAPSVTLKYEKE